MPYVFGYGSLVDRASLEATIGRPIEAHDGPNPARLRGYGRQWNVAAHSSLRPDYAFVDSSGAPWQGWLIFLGIEASPDDVTLGALYRLEIPDLARLDDRERSYDRIDVTDRIEGHARVDPAERVFSYLPKADTRRQARIVGADGTVMERYLRLVDRAYRALGDELYVEHLRALPVPEPFSIREISVAPKDPASRNQAIDPGRS